MFEELHDALMAFDLALPSGQNAHLVFHPSGEGQVFVQFAGADGPQEQGTFADYEQAVQLLNSLEEAVLNEPA